MFLFNQSPTLDVIVHFCSRDQENLIDDLVHNRAIIEPCIRENYVASCLYLPDGVSLGFFHGLRCQR